MSRMTQRINNAERWDTTNKARAASAKRYEPETLVEGEVGIAEIFRNEQGLQVKLTDGKVLSGNNLEYIHGEAFTRILLGGTVYKDVRTAAAKSKFQMDEHVHRCKTEIAQQQEDHTLVTTPDEELNKEKQEEKHRLKRKFQAEADAKRGSTPKSTPTAGATSAKQSDGSGTTNPKERTMRTNIMPNVYLKSDDGGGTAVADAPKKSAKKKGAKKAAPAKAAKKSAKKAAGSKAVDHGTERDHDLPWNEHKVNLFKALKACKAVGQENAVNGATVIAKSGGKLNGKHVRHYSYHAKAAGLIGLVTELEEGGGYGYYLTKKGAALDPVKELKAQEAAKKSKSE